MAVPPGLEHVVDALYPPARQALAEHLAAIGRALFCVDIALQLAALGVVLRWRLAQRAGDALRPMLRREPWVAAALGAAGIVGLAIVTLPLALYRFAILHDYGLSRQPLAGWLRDHAVATFIDALVAALASLAFVALVRRWPRAWPLAAAIVAAPVLVVGNVLYPTVIAPLFNDFRPLPPAALSQRILDVAHANGIDATVVYQYDLSRQSTTANAYVSGLGGFERIALSDNLMRLLDADEVVFIVTHEIGHYVLHHLWWGTLWAWIFTAAAIALVWWVERARPVWTGPDGFSVAGALPVAALALLIFSLVTQPLAMAISRHVEHEADAFAISHAGVGRAGSTAFAKLGSAGLQVLHPPALAVWYFYTHPPLDERIEFASHAPARDR